MVSYTFYENSPVALDPSLKALIEKGGLIVNNKIVIAGLENAGGHRHYLVSVIKTNEWGKLEER